MLHRASRTKTCRLIACAVRRVEESRNIEGSIRKEGLMSGLIHFRTHRENHFHVHPFHGLFALITSIVLAVLLMLLLVPAVK